MPHVRRFAAVALAVLIFVPGAFVVATTSAAFAGATLTIGTPKLLDRVIVNVPLAVTCDVGNPSSVFFPPFVTIEQAAGKQIATGTGTASVPSLPFTVNCDGITVISFVVPVLAAASGPPFHGGPAVITASFSVSGPGGSESASVGPVSVRL
jgi:hypothetical protein